MFFDQDLKGNRLPPGTVCLTYDDGPGPHTAELGAFLHGRGVPATFFVIGRHAEGRLDLLRRLRGWAHLVGNHTYGHPCLVDVAVAGGDVVGEVARCDDLLRQAGAAGTVFLRAPYGRWREWTDPEAYRDKRTSVVAEALQGSGRLPHHVGPVNWDISAQDFDHWKRGAPGEEVARLYLEKTERLGRGIILMHDSSEDEAVRRNNRAFDATRLLVPALQERGYRFVRLDAIPQVQSAVRVSEQVYLRTADGRFVVWTEGDELAVGEEGEVFGLVRLGDGQVALRAANGLYVSAPSGGGPLVARATTIGEAETMEMEEDGAGDRTIRMAGSHYRLERRFDPGT